MQTIIRHTYKAVELRDLFVNSSWTHNVLHLMELEGVTFGHGARIEDVQHDEDGIHLVVLVKDIEIDLSIPNVETIEVEVEVTSYS